MAATVAVPAPTAGASTGSPYASDDIYHLANTIAFRAPTGELRDLHGLVLATGERFPDALAGSGLLSVRPEDRGGVRLALTPTSSLDDRIRRGIADRLAAWEAEGTFGPYGEFTVWILGGPGAVAPAVEAQVRAIHQRVRVIRLAGPDRLATAIAVADEVVRVRRGDDCPPRDTGDEEDLPREPTCGWSEWVSDHPEDRGTWYRNRYWRPEEERGELQLAIARGWGPASAAWADSVAVAGVAAQMGGFVERWYPALGTPPKPAMVVLLTRTEELDDRVEAWIGANDPAIVRLLGGPAALSDATLARAQQVHHDVERVRGPDRAATATAIYAHWVADDVDPHTHVSRGHDHVVGLVNGWDEQGWARAMAAASDGLFIGWTHRDHFPAGLAGLTLTCGGEGELPRRPVLLVGGPATLDPAALAASAHPSRIPECDEHRWFAMAERWNACQPVRIFVNDDFAPPGGHDAVLTAVAELNRFLPRLDLVVEGRTDLRQSQFGEDLRPQMMERWGADQPGRLPILVNWPESSRGPGGLADVGVGPGPHPDLPNELTGGIVMINRTITDRGLMTLTAMHEIMHMLGAEHVWADTELMYESRGPGVVGLGSGDVAALLWLGDYATC